MPYRKELEWTRQGDCIVPTSHKPTKYGYVCIMRNYKKVFLHRLVCQRRHGPLGTLFAIHSCDNRACMNPDHIRPGTQKDNCQDAVSRGRNYTGGAYNPERGEDRYNAKLTEEMVRQIRASNEPHPVLARRFGVARQRIQKVKAGKIWKHVKGGC